MKIREEKKNRDLQKSIETPGVPQKIHRNSQESPQKSIEIPGIPRKIHRNSA